MDRSWEGRENVPSSSSEMGTGILAAGLSHGVDIPASITLKSVAGKPGNSTGDCVLNGLVHIKPMGSFTMPGLLQKHGKSSKRCWRLNGSCDGELKMGHSRPSNQVFFKTSPL